MRNLVLGALLSLFSLQVQKITGDWQGTLGEGTDKIRLVLARERNSSKLFSIDQDPDWGAGQALASVTFEGATLKFKVAGQSNFGAFEGTVDPHTTTIRGSWIQGGFRQPLTFNRATSKTAWKDPYSHSIRFVTVGSGVKLEVLDWGGRGRPILLLAGNGNTAHVFDSFARKLAALRAVGT